MIGRLGKALFGVLRALVRAPFVRTPRPAPRPAPRVQATPPGFSEYLGALAQVDPGLTVSPERAIRRGHRVLDAFQRYEGDQVKVLDYTRQEFDGGHASVDDAKARLILAATLRWMPVEA